MDYAAVPAIGRRMSHRFLGVDPPIPLEIVKFLPRSSTLLATNPTVRQQYRDELSGISLTRNFVASEDGQHCSFSARDCSLAAATPLGML